MRPHSPHQKETKVLFHSRKGYTRSLRILRQQPYAKLAVKKAASWMLNRRKRKRANIADWLRSDEFCVNYLPQGLFWSAAGGLRCGTKICSKAASNTAALCSRTSLVSRRLGKSIEFATIRSSVRSRLAPPYSQLRINLKFVLPLSAVPNLKGQHRKENSHAFLSRCRSHEIVAFESNPFRR
jgi:hypothetical protein